MDISAAESESQGADNIPTEIYMYIYIYIYVHLYMYIYAYKTGLYRGLPFTREKIVKLFLPRTRTYFLSLDKYAFPMVFLKV